MQENEKFIILESQNNSKTPPTLIPNWLLGYNMEMINFFQRSDNESGFIKAVIIEALNFTGF